MPIIRSSHIEVIYKVAVLHLWSKKLKNTCERVQFFVRLQAYSRSGEQLQGRTAFCRAPIFAEHLSVGPSESWGGPFFMKIKYLKTLILEYIPLRGNFLIHGRVK